MTEDTAVEVERLLKNIRSQFYTTVPEKKFFQDRDSLIYAITWPATWLKGRGVFDLALGRAISAAQLAQGRAAEATVDVLAQTHRVLAAVRRRRKTEKPSSQLDLL
jgi:hypothetical protein